VEQRIVHVSDAQSAVSLGWLLPGAKTVTVTVRHLADVAVATHTLTLHPALAHRVRISGPFEGQVGAALPFTAMTTVGTVLLPDTYVWEATDLSPVTHTNTVWDTIALTWHRGGRKHITVTVKHREGTLLLYDRAYHTVIIQASYAHIYLPVVLRRHP
jgi:hypothetical protein